jgi:hypothetical protein
LLVFGDPIKSAQSSQSRELTMRLTERRWLDGVAVSHIGNNHGAYRKVAIRETDE